MIPEGGAERFERKRLKVFLVELALGPLEKIREGISLEEHEHSPPPRSFYYKFTDVASRRLSFPRRFSIEDSTGWLLAKKLRWKLRQRSRTSRPPLDRSSTHRNGKKADPATRPIDRSYRFAAPVITDLLSIRRFFSGKKKRRIRDSRTTKRATRHDRLRTEAQTATWSFSPRDISAGLGVLHQPSSVEFCLYVSASEERDAA